MQKNNMQNTKFKVGQAVWCLLYGKGRVSDVDGFVEVDFGWTAELYTFEGAHAGSSESTMGHRTKRTLFFSEPQVIAATEPVFEPKLVGKTVLVYSLGTPAHAGEVTAEDSDEVVTQYYAWSKRSYTFHEVNSQPITFD